MVMSAVSSVRTPGVLVTVMPRWVAVATSMLSTPAPKLAISFRFGPARLRSRPSILSVTVDTRTSAVARALARPSRAQGVVGVVQLHIEEFAHPRLHRIGQLARDDDFGLAGGHA